MTLNVILNKNVLNISFFVNALWTIVFIYFSSSISFTANAQTKGNANNADWIAGGKCTLIRQSGVVFEPPSKVFESTIETKNTTSNFGVKSVEIDGKKFWSITFKNGPFIFTSVNPIQEGQILAHTFYPRQDIPNIRGMYSQAIHFTRVFKNDWYGSLTSVLTKQTGETVTIIESYSCDIVLKRK
ncbi:MAG: hypothetical protein COA91_11870 [Robiginitomaculum sp.]|nr:MAG: hypothetical protein COA91_11870 [Robiginitomaculum sp.]